MGKRSLGLFLLISVVALDPWIGSAMASYVKVTEERWQSDSIFSFRIHTDREDIHEFAVGNDDAYKFKSYINWKGASLPRDWSGSTAYKKDGKWHKKGGDPLNWLDKLEGFSNYSYAFVFYGSTPLPAGTSGWFCASLISPGSATSSTTRERTSSYFTVKTKGGEIITGQTSPVPIPSAVLLFGPGLIGLVAVRRKFTGRQQSFSGFQEHGIQQGKLRSYAEFVPRQR